MGYLLAGSKYSQRSVYVSRYVRLCRCVTDRPGVQGLQSGPLGNGTSRLTRRKVA